QMIQTVQWHRNSFLCTWKKNGLTSTGSSNTSAAGSITWPFFSDPSFARKSHKLTPLILALSAGRALFLKLLRIYTIMALEIWLPGLFLLGLVSMGVCFLF